MSEPITALIVDDETLARRGLNIRLRECDNVTVIGQCSNGREALQSIGMLRPQLVFLDIQMPGLDGFDVVKAMQGDDMPAVIFVTAFDQYAVDAFNVHAVDYILKPVELERLQAAVKKVRKSLEEKNAMSEKATLLKLIDEISGTSPENLNVTALPEMRVKASYPEKISVKDGGNLSIVKVADIDWIDAAGDYMCLHVGETIHIMRSTMKQLEKQLDPELFQRVHRSTIVNLDRVKQVCSHINGEYNLVLECGSRLKMSRSFKEKVKRFI